MRSGFNNCYVPRFSTYGPVFYGSYSAPAAVILPRNQPVIVQPVIGQPVAGQRIIGAVPFNNAALKNALKENDRRWNQPVNVKPVEKRNVRRAKPSSLAAKRSSMKLQAVGDVYLRKQEYDKAATRYRSAVFFANDRAEAHIRLGYAQTASGQYSAAVASFKNALVLDANWPMKGESIGKVFGRENEIAFTQILGNVTRWAKADIRDSNRLFLLGVLLHFSNQTEKSSLVFTAAYRLAGHGNHLVAFLTPKRGNSKPAAKIEIPQPVGIAKVPALPADPKLTPPAPPIPPPLNPQAKPKQNGPTLIVPPLPKL